MINVVQSHFYTTELFPKFLTCAGRCEGHTAHTGVLWWAEGGQTSPLHFQHTNKLFIFFNKVKLFITSVGPKLHARIHTWLNWPEQILHQGICEQVSQQTTRLNHLLSVRQLETGQKMTLNINQFDKFLHTCQFYWMLFNLLTPSRSLTACVELHANVSCYISNYCFWFLVSFSFTCFK